jgi:hypothetical protein
MGSAVKYISYSILTILSITCLIYYLANTEIWDLYGYNLGFIVLIASIIYTGYMFFFELVKPAEAQLIVGSENVEVVPVPERDFMQDVYFKYLFSFSFAVLLFYIIHVLRTNFESFDIYPSNWYYFADLYVNLILPVFLLCDMIITSRYRHRHAMADISILFLICFAHCAYKVLMRAFYYHDTKVVWPTIADYIMIYLISLNGYALYDFSLFRKINPVGNYAAFC